ncbi:hypothetical protein Patl1_32527 [Pistacia atlantica]|uniref:Uncharacterized protein n=1 Tax=Pistacia atlantica TaxID=434234 RepID=A0ACC1AP41_9ROSI|nr:hypothetical protein Patl1_32527 [Pistacia atlantica]
MLEPLNFVNESSDQDLLLDVPSNSSFPQAELRHPALRFGQQASTSSSSVYPNPARPYYGLPKAIHISLRASHRLQAFHVAVEARARLLRALNILEFKRALNDDRYRPTLLEDFYEEFTKLTQTGMVRDYQPKFNRLLARARSLTEQQQISCFVSGLKETICIDRLSLIDCAHDDVVEGTEEIEEDHEVAQISLNAITSTTTPQTIRVPGKIYGRPLMVLLNIGSTHNFLNHAWASRFELKTEEGEKMNVMVANG